MTSPDGPGLLLRTLGGTALEGADGTGAGLGPGLKPLLVAAYLAFSRGPVDAHTLASLLWPKVDPEKARGSLRTAIHTLRKTSGAALVRRDGTTLELREELTSTCSCSPTRWRVGTMR